MMRKQVSLDGQPSLQLQVDNSSEKKNTSVKKSDTKSSLDIVNDVHTQAPNLLHCLEKMVQLKFWCSKHKIYSKPSDLQPTCLQNLNNQL